MIMPSSFIIFQFSIVVLLLATFTTTTNIPQPTSLISEISQPYYDQRNSAAVFPGHLDQLSSASKHLAFNPEVDSSSDEEYDNEYLKTIWPDIISKRYANKAIRGGGDSRLWAIPYRFGKRAVMPYRFGKRAGMNFRFGKQSASL